MTLFKTIAAAMLTAGQQNSGGKYFVVLGKASLARRLMKWREANALREVAGTGHTQASTLADVAGIPINARPSCELPTTHVGEDLPFRIRQWIPVPKIEFRLLDKQTQRYQGRVLDCTASRRIAFTSDAQGKANGAVVTITDRVAVQADREGRIVSSHYHQADRGQEKRVHDHVAKLVARRRVH